MVTDYRHTRDAIWAPVNVNDHLIRLRAEAVRKERTGIHARIEIWWDKTRLCYDQFNVERQEERTRLMKRAYGMIQKEYPEISEAITLDQATLELDAFCGDLWTAHVGGVLVDVEMPGDINLPPPRMMGPYVIEEGGTIIHGQPGSGKSWMLYLIAQSINHGSSKLWPVRKKARVLLLNLERSRSSVQQRIGCINRTLDLPLDAWLDTLNMRGKSLKDVADAAREHCHKYNIDVVALDSISRSGLGSLNRDEVANEIIDLMNSICPTWIALGHQAKPDPESNIDPTNFGCHSEDTEVLTSFGWVPHNFVRRGFNVANFNLETGKLEWGVVQETHTYDYEGEMVHLGGQTQDILVTPNHRMVVKTLTRAGNDGVWSNDWAFTTAGELKANSRVPYATTFTNDETDLKRIDIDGHLLPLDPFLRYIGWWISEGCTSNRSDPVLTQAQGALADTMVEVVQELGLPHHIGRYANYGYQGKEHELPVQHLAIRRSPWLSEWLKEKCGHLARNKKIPAFVFGLSLRQQRLVFDALMEGDGSWDKSRPDTTPKRGGAGGSGNYATTSKTLADDVQRLAIQLGYSAIVRPQGRAKPHHHDRYAVLIGNRRYIGIHKRLGHVRRVPYSGKVYCLTVPTGAYLTRRNGKMAITGNSAMFYAGADMMVRLESRPIWNQNLDVTMTIDKANVAVSREPANFLYEMDALGLLRVQVGAAREAVRQITVQEVYDSLGEGSNWAGAIAAQLGADHSEINRILKDHPELFEVVLTDDQQRIYYRAA